MNVDQIRQRFKWIDADQYPELAGVSRDQIYAGRMGPGGLYLASDMARRVPFEKGMRVIDVGCGRGSTSRYLAKSFDVLVYAVDLWISATELHASIRTAGLDNKVLPFNLDVTKTLPFPEDYFDVLFCMDAFHYFGAERGFLAHIARYLRPGAFVVVGNPCFDREFTQPPPPVYRAPWVKEFSKYHSLLWWRDLFADSGLFESVAVEEPTNGEIYWEDDVMFELEGATNKATPRLEADADQIVFGRDNPEYPRLTHYILTCRKSTK